MRLFHRSKTFFGVITETHKPRLVLEIVWKIESDVGIEPNAVLSEHGEGFLGRQHAMLDSRAACTRSADHRFGALRMDHCAEALHASFATGGIELFLREGRRTAFPDAEGREDLDEIGPFRFLLSNIFAKLLGRQPRVGHLVERSEDPWARQHAARNGIAKRLVGRRAYTLYSGESRHQCDVRGSGLLDAAAFREGNPTRRFNNQTCLKRFDPQMCPVLDRFLMRLWNP